MGDTKVLCTSCDIYCSLVAEKENGRVVRVRPADQRPLYANICVKGLHAPQGFAHQKRLMYPLARVGERGGGEWRRVTWDEALDDIAARLRRVINVFGPEGFAVATSQWNTGTENGMGRRFMNLLGSPNWIGGVAMCAGNTAAVNRHVYGWFPYPDYATTKCIALFGHNPKQHSWTPVYNSIRRAQQQGAKLIVLDPRRSESAERADLWLPLKIGTDAAMCFGWLNVMLTEGLYDTDFARDWTVGFDAFKRRVMEWPLERVEATTGVDRDLIVDAARMYARNTPGVIPWTPVTDQQRNSTSAIRLHCALRALSGSLDVKGGEILHGFNSEIISESEIEMHEALSEGQRAKQLGSQRYPIFTYRGAAPLADPTERVWGVRHANIVAGSFMATPSATFRAMADGDPYPVKAFISLGNNTLMSFANMQLIQRALLNQDLFVVHEQFMTPTAQLADYVLPGDSWLERSALADGFGWTAIYRSSKKAVEPPGECRGVFDFWRALAVRMGLEERFPWSTNEEMLDYRVARTKLSFEEFAEKNAYFAPPPNYKKYEATGFATPSGKVELWSATFEEFGFDPLPYYREDVVADDDFPLMMFPGVRDDEFFQTGHRHIEALRARRPEPEFFLNAATADRCGVEDGEWVEIKTKQGSARGKALVRDDMPDDLIRVPHGWWRPETPENTGTLSDALLLADAQLCPDDPDFLDNEQGIPHLKGIPCRIEKLPLSTRRIGEEVSLQ